MNRFSMRSLAMIGLFSVIGGLLLLWMFREPIVDQLRGQKRTPGWEWRGVEQLERQVNGAPVYKMILDSPRLAVDSIYKSMTGPASTFYFQLQETGFTGLAWIVGYRVKIIGDTVAGMPAEEFMCHNNLDYGVEEYYESFGLEDRWQNQTSRLFTLSQGQSAMYLPQGFGIPIMDGHSLSATAQVLNHNLPEIDTRLRHRIEILLVRDRELRQPLKPVYQQSISLMAPVEGQSPQPLDTGITMCLPAPASAQHHLTASDGNTYTGHWVVPPGEEVRRFPVSAWLALKFATNVHAVGVHLHPYAEKVELVDKTTGNVLFSASAETHNDRIGLGHIDRYVSAGGFEVSPDHDYEIVCYSNNTSGEEQDMMAVLLLYLFDPDLDEIINKKKA